MFGMESPARIIPLQASVGTIVQHSSSGCSERSMLHMRCRLKRNGKRRVGDRRGSAIHGQERSQIGTKNKVQQAAIGWLFGL